MFLEQVTLWQRKLGTVDVVLSTWFDVQRKWQALESIFVGSADIRVQLPGDSARFDALNVDFKVCGTGGQPAFDLCASTFLLKGAPAIQGSQNTCCTQNSRSATLMVSNEK